MQITFLVGNGFDLNLGLSTRYIDFYNNCYSKATLQHDAIRELLKDNIDENWSDFEMAFGKSIRNVEERNFTKEEIMNSKIEFVNLLAEYLENEQQSFIINEVNGESISNEAYNSITNFNKELADTDKLAVDSLLAKNNNSAYVVQFISFNYTNTLDRVIDKIKEYPKIAKSANFSLGKVHHVHGTTKQAMIIGVDNDNQISGSKYKNDSNFTKLIIKEKINTEIGQRRSEIADSIIARSKIIGVFGMSLGLTDSKWWKKIAEWLRRDASNKLILYMYNPNDSERTIAEEIITRKDYAKNLFISRADIKTNDETKNELKQRIFVVNSSDFLKIKTNIDN